MISSNKALYLYINKHPLECYMYNYLKNLTLPTHVISGKYTHQRLILWVALAIPLFYNQTFWLGLFNRFETINLPSLGFAVLFYCLMVLIVYLLLSMLFTLGYLIRLPLLKPSIYLLILSSAAITYFNHIGIVIDEAMIKNILQTNNHEALELINPKFVAYLIVLGVIPIIIISRITLLPVKSLVHLKNFTLVSATMATLITGLLLSNFQFTTFFGRENRDLRLYVNPIFPMLSVRKYIREEFKTPEPFVNIGIDAKQHKKNGQRKVGIIVLGETARADHFSLNGYAKNTTPNLSKRLAQGQLFNFSHVTSCGTSTAYSVPCIFSLLGAQDYTPKKASNQTNVLDILELAGVKTVWRDNNSSCKGVCERIESENFTLNPSQQSPYYHEGAYLDEVLLSNLKQKIDNSSQDMLIVLHQLGSHGPAYHRRYPKEFAKFSPNCTSNSPQSCTPEEVNNSYDNTILYTDTILEKTIAFLEQGGEEYDSFMLYVSDHGESLGENGIYLHGLPKAIAPESQTHVPMILWLSTNASHHLPSNNSIAINDNPATSIIADINCTQRELSHDYISHTLLAAFDIESHVKNNEYNLFNAQCLSNIVVADNSILTKPETSINNELGNEKQL